MIKYKLFRESGKSKGYKLTTSWTNGKLEIVTKKTSEELVTSTSTTPVANDSPTTPTPTSSVTVNTLSLADYKYCNVTASYNIPEHQDLHARLENQESQIKSLRVENKRLKVELAVTLQYL